MSVVSIYCHDCDNDGKERNDGSKTGFQVDVMATALIRMSNYNGDEADVIGQEMMANPLQAIFDAQKKNGITCMACGSQNVDVRCGPDMVLEREQAQILDQMEDNQDNLAADIAINVGNDDDDIVDLPVIPDFPIIDIPEIGRD